MALGAVIKQKDHVQETIAASQQFTFSTLFFCFFEAKMKEEIRFQAEVFILMCYRRKQKLMLLYKLDDDCLEMI